MNQDINNRLPKQLRGNWEVSTTESWNDSPCWNWTGKLGKGGYGESYDPGTLAVCGVHRIAYMYLVGDIPEGLQIDHRCKNRRCINPGHLEAVTRAVNMRRAFPVNPSGPLASVILARIDARGQTVRSTALEAGLSPVALMRQLRSGKFKIGELFALAQVFGCTTSELIADAESEVAA